MSRNKFGIPEDVLSRIRSRDQTCVYCGREMLHPYATKTASYCATIEHLNRFGPFYWRDGLQEEHLALCCGSCNSSRGVKRLLDWFATPYCVERNINSDTVAAPVKEYLKDPGSQV